MSRSDIGWYGRTSVWVGTGLLLVMALSGAQVAIVTVLSVLSIISGLILLVYSIPFRRATAAEKQPPENFNG